MNILGIGKIESVVRPSFSTAPAAVALRGREHPDHIGAALGLTRRAVTSSGVGELYLTDLTTTSRSSAGRRERFGLRTLPRARAGRAANCPSRFGCGVRPQRRLGALHGKERSGVRADLGRPMSSAAVDINAVNRG